VRVRASVPAQQPGPIELKGRGVVEAYIVPRRHGNVTSDG
jgi:hypothetical protein